MNREDKIISDVFLIMKKRRLAIEEYANEVHLSALRMCKAMKWIMFISATIIVLLIMR